ncbi:unnamed protein product [Paramecium primaurelia]|uniref:Uncharacterized protein n=1 Tax=Paramecium primaurelia TaxID=5886 RepID=A0A8S1LIF7_PARPR|nr:unnamed protein product [Paramecium primaurelia]
MGNAYSNNLNSYSIVLLHFHKKDYQQLSYLTNVYLGILYVFIVLFNAKYYGRINYSYLKKNHCQY